MCDITRRSFLRQSALAAGIAPWVGASAVRAGLANEKVNIACIGVGGKGFGDLTETSVGHNVVALCDVDAQVLARAAEKFPDAKKYTDWRKLLEHPGIDAVTVSTPDHTHAPATMTAMQLGKHVFTQKPLTHTIYEARRLAEVAAEKGLVTQMGIQHHATARLKIAVQVIRDGVIGKVSEVHVWTDRPVNFWKQGQQRPKETSPVPDYLDWDQWLGVAPERPYVDGVYHRFNWRGWWDFGTGVAGDMGCHMLDPVVNALELGPPASVYAPKARLLPESGPARCILRSLQTRHTAETLRVSWYEATKAVPRREIFQRPDDRKAPTTASCSSARKATCSLAFPKCRNCSRKPISPATSCRSSKTTTTTPSGPRPSPPAAKRRVRSRTPAR
ncbi:MAG: Gfo/Idh/MocA family oxidoreductase [Planctomycetaceae bacterium]